MFCALLLKPFTFQQHKCSSYYVIFRVLLVVWSDFSKNEIPCSIFIYNSAFPAMKSYCFLFFLHFITLYLKKHNFELYMWPF